MPLMMEKFPLNLNFFLVGDNDNLVQACNCLSLNEDNSEFVSFLCCDRGQNMGAEKIWIRHTSKVKDEIVFQKIEEEDKQFLIKIF